MSFLGWFCLYEVAVECEINSADRLRLVALSFVSPSGKFPARRPPAPLRPPAPRPMAGCARPGWLRRGQPGRMCAPAALPGPPDMCGGPLTDILVLVVVVAVGAAPALLDPWSMEVDRCRLGKNLQAPVEGLEPLVHFLLLRHARNT